MKDEAKTKGQLIQELSELHQRVAELEKSEAERKRAEELLRKSEEKYIKTFQSNPVSVGLSRMSDGLIVEANKAMSKLLGYREEELCKA
jgi:PAS domain-containing protein